MPRDMAARLYDGLGLVRRTTSNTFSTGRLRSLYEERRALLEVRDGARIAEVDIRQRSDWQACTNGLVTTTLVVMKACYRLHGSLTHRSGYSVGDEFQQRR